MKPAARALIGALCLASSAWAAEPQSTLQLESQSGLTGCAAKLERLENELAWARQHGNSRQARGLERAIAAAQHCDDAALRADREKDLRQAEEKVRERERELQEEQNEGDPKDIGKAKRKLEEAQSKLAQARAELNR